MLIHCFKTALQSPYLFICCRANLVRLPDHRVQLTCSCSMPGGQRRIPPLISFRSIRNLWEDGLWEEGFREQGFFGRRCL